MVRKPLASRDLQVHSMADLQIIRRRPLALLQHIRTLQNMVLELQHMVRRHLQRVLQVAQP